MAITHHYTILCEYLLRQDNGSDVYAGTYSNIEVNQFPTIHHLNIAIGFSGAPDEEYIAVAVFDPEGNPIFDSIFGARSESPKLQNEFQQQIDTAAILADLAFLQPGVYHVALLDGTTLVHSRPFGCYLKEQFAPTIEEKNDVLSISDN